ncbi:MAG: hypothetical protein JO320_08440 [Alphaproteobacteria bacterium]|nr:hypothetical protein [Alphaproteobacteria bacterium]
MAMLKELAGELIGMFVGEVRLTVSVLATVAAVGLLVRVSGLDPLLGGVALLLSCLALLVDSVLRGARPRGSK